MELKQFIRSRLGVDSRAYNILAIMFALATLSKSRFKGAIRRLRRSGIFFEASELWMCSLAPTSLLEILISELGPRTVLDVGCGTGQSLSFLAGRGVEVLGIEGSALAIQHGTIPSRMLRVDLRRRTDLERRFDVVWSYEVAEHIHPRYVDVFVDTLVRHGDRIVMSAAQPGQGGEGHFNEQPAEYWIAHLERRGFALDEALTAKLRAAPDEFARNMMAFVRRSTVHGGESTAAVAAPPVSSVR